MDKVKEIIIRYVLAFFPFIFFNQVYWFLKYITFNMLSLIFSLFAKVNTNFSENTIYINEQSILLIEPCIAVSAFILLFLLNITSPDIDFKKRIYSFFLSIIFLFIFNIIRIIFLFSIFNFQFFDIVHLIVWYGLSTLVVFLDWILMIKLFNIKTIPVISDIIYLIFYIKQDIKRSKS